MRKSKLHSRILSQDVEVFLSNVCAETLQENGAFIVFKTPFSQEIEVFAGQEKDWKRLPLRDLHKLSKAFLVHTFEHQEDNSCYALMPSIHLKLEQADQKKLSYSCRNGQKKHWDQIFLKQPTELHIPASRYGTPAASPEVSKEGYIKMVEAAVKAARHNQLQKVVLSRYKRLSYQSSKRLIHAFLELTALYPATFTYFLCAPEVGVWMGATPELLASCNEGVFRSMALAATQAVPMSGRLGGVKWTKKEQEELELVQTHILSQLNALGFAKVSKQPTETIRIGNLLHLRTLISSEVAKTHVLQRKLLQYLHPTPALCGYPVAAANAFIKEHEEEQRTLYGGFLGPMYEPSSYQMHVNIRCARFYQDHLQLYAGGGILAGSDPYKEWLETELKCMAMQKLFSL